MENDNFKFFGSDSRTLTIKGFNTEKEAQAWCDLMNEASEGRFYKIPSDRWENAKTSDCESPAYVMTAEQFKEIV